MIKIQIKLAQKCQDILLFIFFVIYSLLLQSVQVYNATLNNINGLIISTHKLQSKI